jgi:hypothetical protein
VFDRPGSTELTGRVLDTDPAQRTGTRLAGVARPAGYRRTFLTLWLVAVGIFLLAGVALVISDPAGSTVPSVVIPALMLAGGLGFACSDATRAHTDIGRVRTWLQDELSRSDR